MNPWRAVLLDLGDRVDADLVPALYAAASLKTEDVRRQLADEELAYHDPATGRTPDEHELELSTQAVIRRASRGASLTGALAGLGGFAAVPPEILASIVQSVRLAQRLAVIYGHDPETDRGALLLQRALAAAYEVQLPDQGASGVRVRDLPQTLGKQVPDVQRATVHLARTLALRAATRVGGRISRLVPGIGAGISLWSARKRTREQGARMADVYRRAWGGGFRATGPIEDAVEIA